MADETTYYTDQSGVRVTDKRVMVNNVTYAMANITSVSTAVEKPSLSGPILFMIVGGICLLAGLGNKSGTLALTGVVLGVAGYLWFRGCKPLWHLRIASASGSQRP